MGNISDLLGIGLLYAAYFVFPIVAGFIAIYLLIARPDFLFLIFVGVIVFFNSQTSGAIGVDANTIYYRGSGPLFLPVLTWIIIGGFVSSFSFGDLILKPVKLKASVAKIYWAIFVLCLGHFLVGFILGVSPKEIISNNGLFPIFLSSLFFLWGSRLADAQKIQAFFNFLIIAIFVRCIFGLIRYTFSNGDPVNIYENIEKLGIKVVFFDFHDSTLATLLVLFSIVSVMLNKPKAFSFRLFYYLSIIFGGLVIIFSQHRASLIGLFLGGLVLAPFIHRQQRILFLGGLFLASFSGFIAITVFRLSKLKTSISGVSSLIYDFTGKSSFGPETARTLESKQALSTILDHPVLGVGSWGKYQGFGIGWQELAGKGAYQTVHNGFLQIALKSGAVGLSLICLLFYVHARSCIRFSKESTGWYRCAYVASFGTFVAMLPNFAIGMVMAQQRGLFLLALLILLPYAIRCAQDKESVNEGIIDECLKNQGYLQNIELRSYPHSHITRQT